MSKITDLETSFGEFNPKKLISLKALIILLGILASAGCTTSENKNKIAADTLKIIGVNKPAIKELPIVDTGQSYFFVNAMKNDAPFIHYEGDYPIGSRLDSDFTLQFNASRHILDVSDMINIDIYIKSIVTGSFPLVTTTEQGKANLILTPLKGTTFEPVDGSVAITKYSETLISGKFEGHGIDPDSNKVSITGYFLNVKYSGLPPK
jgi:hypothetical protein